LKPLIGTFGSLPIVWRTGQEIEDDFSPKLKGNAFGWIVGIIAWSILSFYSDTGTMHFLATMQGNLDHVEYR
jgi:hypothetical protein